MKKRVAKTTLEVASAIRLEEAYFCLNCELVTNCSDICPACGRRELWSLEKWLGRLNTASKMGWKKKAVYEGFAKRMKFEYSQRLEGSPPITQASRNSS
jgi:RNA polymerase subunit RPABC4/transcription elongation factor Spt4